MNYGISNKSGKIKSSEIFKILNYLKKIILIPWTLQVHIFQVKKKLENITKKLKKNSLLLQNILLKITKILNLNLKTLNSLGYIPNTILAHNYKDYLNPNFFKEINFIKKKYPIKNIGVSLYNVAELKRILNFKRPDIIQVPLNILDKRFLKKDLIKSLKKRKLKFK